MWDDGGERLDDVTSAVKVDIQDGWATHVTVEVRYALLLISTSS